MNLCIMIAEIYLMAWTPDIIRLTHKPTASELTDAYRWTLEKNETLQAYHICNAKYKTCISTAPQRKLENYEVLVLEKPSVSNENNLWDINDAIGTVRTMVKPDSKFYYYWNVQHTIDEPNHEPLQLLWETHEEQANRFGFVKCEN